MDIRIGALVLLLAGTGPIVNTDVHPNSYLPSQRAIWPLPEIATPISVDASFHSLQDVKKVQEGEWITTTILVTYRVDHVLQGTFDGREITFLCDQKWPTPESGIMLKSLIFPFRPGTAGTFFLDGKPGHYYIRSYRLADRNAAPKAR